MAAIALVARIIEVVEFDIGAAANMAGKRCGTGNHCQDKK